MIAKIDQLLNTSSLLTVSVLLAIAVYLFGCQFIRGEGMRVTGRLIVPSTHISLFNSPNISVFVESDSEVTESFELNKLRIENLLKIPENREGNPPALVTVAYFKNIWGSRIGSEIIQFQPGWIRRPK